MFESIDLHQQNLDDALPSLTEKLIQFKNSISHEDGLLLVSIINSSAEHLRSLNDTNSGQYNLMFDKPISAVASPAMKQYILNLPNILVA